LIRFGSDFDLALTSFWPFIALSAVVFAAAIYIFGLYSTHSASQGVIKRAAILALCMLVGQAMFVGGTYLHSFHPIGRGAVLICGGLAYGAILIHHLFLLHILRNARERVAYIISSDFDELETRLFRSFGTHHLDFVGVIEHNRYHATGDVCVLGDCSDLVSIVRRHGITRVLCTGKSLHDTTLLKPFCELRYSGVTVMPLVSLCEEIDQYVPIELLSPEWLLHASGEPHLLYIKKVKRLFDVVASIFALILAFPILVAAVLAVKLTSPGPVFYRQGRLGRFGKVFWVTKLRTMCVNAEAGGPVWSSENDPRVTPVGRLLRKYRIDELPQLFHVLMGDMSFVGPRPERPEIVDKLADSIPYYQERHMVQPGISGWAQVNYPYGSSVEDSRRKLEYDLYYMKNMSLFLDLFILLDTVRIVVCGGVNSGYAHTPERTKALLDFQISTRAATAAAVASSAAAAVVVVSAAAISDLHHLTSV
jgi:exopolysaccharide biosynthesis polyprenyl glycosylphosphotransferase